MSEQEYKNTQPTMKMPSRRTMRELMMPSIGYYLDNKYPVIYINNGKFRLTAKTNENEMPVIGTTFQETGKIYEVIRTDEKKEQFNAVFKGFVENKIEEAPVLEEEEVVKLV
jgi:hypothetical protein